MSTTRKTRHSEHGAVLVLSMIFVVIFSALAVAMAGLAGTNVQVASNHRRVNVALCAAQSGLECAKYIVSTASFGETNLNYVTVEQADQVWANLCQHARDLELDGQTMPGPSSFSDAGGSGDAIVTPVIDLGNAGARFAVRFYRYDSDPFVIRTQSVGTNGQISRRITMDMDITKDREVLKYAIASAGRMWLTGDTTIHGDLYSCWDRVDISPFNMTDESAVRGTINTVLELDAIDDRSWQMETLDVNDNPIDADGVPLGLNYEDRYYGSDDEVQAYHEGINYGQPSGSNIPGMNISDYNTDMYNSGLTEIPSCPSSEQITEYFPHASGDYTEPKYSASHRYSRHVYENQTFTNALLPVNRHALFKNCTFEEVLYVDCYKSSTSQPYTNNVRFENCTFNGVIVTDVPQPFDWIDNCLYFTGAANFNNRSSVQEATILAPHFNVNLGNTNPETSDHNVLTGAIVGGIVDVRGNAQIDGTIISMYDTTPHSSGYVTNIGATLEDGGSETTELGDVGVIAVTPREDMMLPSGITSPIIIIPKQETYAEGS
ncbi:MAG: pilus assembly PilX N-terminal domain-containing protein [Sedimentisphaerales bacterium]|nr:pilus assembly PilX N-terminal domain-containing protein [Sedimentisphaerales bacterium]